MSRSLLSRKSWLTLVMAVAASVVFSETIRAQEGTTYTHSLHGYSVDLPAGWREIPRPVVRRTLENITAENLRFDAAFEPLATSRWFECPYVAVQYMSYSSLGLYRTPRDAEIRDLARTLTGMDFDKIVKDSVKADFKDLLGTVEAGKVAWDPARHRLTWTMGIQNLKGVSAIYFGKYSAIQVIFYTTEERWEKDLLVGAEVLNSFTFDSSHAYPQAWELSLDNR
jgi:hypothetical protein